MRAGPLRKWIELQRATDSRTTAGGYTKTWSTYACTWCDIRPARGSEFERAEVVQHKRPSKVTMRWPGQTVYAKDRIIHVDNGSTRTFNIESVVDVGERKAMLEAMVLEEV